MFFHPTLKNITLSCLNFEADMDAEMVAVKQKSTPLQSLTLIECNVDVQFLDVVLSLPKALKELCIGERLHVFECKPSMDTKKRTSSALFLTALQRQAESLQRLVHIGGQLDYIPARERDPDGAARLRSLTSLETLELGFESHLNYYLRANGFPPSLRTLKLLDAALSVNAGPDILSMANVAFQSVTTLVRDCMPLSMPPDFKVHLHFADNAMFRLYVIQNPSEGDGLFSTLFLDRPSIYKIATMLKSYNAKLHITRETFPSGTAYIPPYMYGEESPVDEKVYDSDDFWRFDGVDYQYMDDLELRERLAEKDMLKVCRRCKRHDKHCQSLGDGSPCVSCRRAYLRCTWEYDDDSIEEEEAQDEAEWQQVLVA